MYIVRSSTASQRNNTRIIESLFLRGRHITRIIIVRRYTNVHTTHMYSYQVSSLRLAEPNFVLLANIINSMGKNTNLCLLSRLFMMF